MYTKVLKVVLSLLCFAILGFSNDVKVDARNASTTTYARKSVKRTRYYYFNSHREYLVSPNNQYTIVRSSNRRNFLYDLSSDRLITSIRCRGSYQGSGSISTNWRRDSQVALITYNGQWAPRDVCLVSVAGAQVNIYNRMQYDAHTFLAQSYDSNYWRNRNRLVFDFFRSDSLLRITNNRITVLARLYTPNNTYSQSLLMNYRYQIIGDFIEFNLVNIRIV